MKRISGNEISCLKIAENGILPDFKYTEVIINSSEVKGIDFALSMYPGCLCEDICAEDDCPCILQYGVNYDNAGHLLKLDDKQDAQSSPTFECNNNCTCAASCNNRLSQKSLENRLQIFKTTNRGLGVRSLDDISKSHLLCMYSGELISYSEAKKRAEKINGQKPNYMFVLKEHIAEEKILKTHIDATFYGNIARFINHSCNPNIEIHPVRTNTPVPRICLFAKRDIKRGEEVTFCYGGNAATSEENFDNFTKCLCGEVTCFGYLPYDESLFQM